MSPTIVRPCCPLPSPPSFPRPCCCSCFTSSEAAPKAVFVVLQIKGNDKGGHSNQQGQASPAAGNLEQPKWGFKFRPFVLHNVQAALRVQVRLARLKQAGYINIGLRVIPFLLLLTIYQVAVWVAVTLCFSCDFGRYLFLCWEKNQDLGATEINEINSSTFTLLSFRLVPVFDRRRYGIYS